MTSVFLLLLTVIIIWTVFSIPAPSGNQHTNTSTSLITRDQFNGVIVNEVYYNGLGTIIADRDCRTDRNGLTTCTAVIKSDDGKIIEFKYTHDMSLQPCLSPGERVQVYTNQGGKAVIVRL